MILRIHNTQLCYNNQELRLLTQRGEENETKGLVLRDYRNPYPFFDRMWRLPGYDSLGAYFPTTTGKYTCRFRK
jgi:hypothetical protein